MPKVLKAWLDSLSEEDANRVAYYLDGSPDAITDMLNHIGERFPNCASWPIPKEEI